MRLAAFFPLALSALACGQADTPPERAPAAAAVTPAAAPSRMDACRLVTQAEATTLFGQAAARETGVAVTDPNMIGECIWGHASEDGSHQLQVRVWASPQYYSAPADAFTQPLDVGEKGYVRVHAASGVDIAFVQGGRVVELSYFTVGGANFPKATDRVDSVKQLARRASTRL
jgi:hypothetical protein